MYELIKSLIDHVWQTSSMSNTEQQALYYISGAVIIILTVTFIDLFYRFIRSVLNRR